MSILKSFEDWLNIHKPKSVSNYISGYKTINRLAEKYNYETLHDNISLIDFDSLNKKLINIPEFIELNKKGNNMYSATLSNFKLFLMEENTKIVIPEVVKPFPDFGWKWATTGITSNLNKPQYLKPVLDAILINGNGKDTYNNDFKELIRTIGVNKYNLSDVEVERISKLDKEDPHKTIIENSASYWLHLGLLNNTGRNVTISELGMKYSNGEISDFDFVKYTIENYEIPSVSYDNNEIEEFQRHNIKIKPLKIIFEILVELQQYNKQNYLIEDDLKTVVVPLSIIFSHNNIGEFVKHIINYRENPNLYSSFPDCTNQYTGDKGLRMLNEYLYFLECFGILKSDMPGNARTSGKKYSLNISTLKDNGINIPKYQGKGFNRIYYGPPGTGKSHSIKEYLKEKQIDKDHYTRVTFHPDYDYASFIGAYKPNMSQDKDSKIQYSFVPQVFTNIYLKAWEKPKEDFYLVIEEINRGNCAEIFGDIFQLLDRDPEYDIEPSQELFTYIQKNNPSALIDGKMRMPSNLYILASMNTSDQSLFPMDSAFKRRWEWKYVKIDYKCTESDFLIEIRDNTYYKWLAFLEAVNDVIFRVTKSEDKQIGNWFLKGDKNNDRNDYQGVINREDFLNKVIFYLWNDVFKDEINDLFKNSKEEEINLSHFFDTTEGEDLLETFLKLKLKLGTA